MTTIQPNSVRVTDHQGGGYLVTAIWANVDRPDTGGTVVKDVKTADRLADAIMAGIAYYDATVATDVNGQTYVQASRRFMGKYVNADLRKMGF